MPHHAGRRDGEEPWSRSRKKLVPVEAKPASLANTPYEALDRISIPEDAMSRIAEALSTAASIIVSDQGIATGETGAGTDFIIPLR